LLHSASRTGSQTCTHRTAYTQTCGQITAAQLLGNDTLPVFQLPISNKWYKPSLRHPPLRCAATCLCPVCNPQHVLQSTPTSTTSGQQAPGMTDPHTCCPSRWTVCPAGFLSLVSQVLTNINLHMLPCSPVRHAPVREAFPLAAPLKGRLALCSWSTNYLTLHGHSHLVARHLAPQQDSLFSVRQCLSQHQ
jgi:hypothetical protein